MYVFPLWRDYQKWQRNAYGKRTQSSGDYGKAVRPETIAQKHTVNSQAPSEDIARLAGIRFANISEPSRGLVLNAAQVKNMTGNDTLNARFLNENSFDFEPQFKLYINTNYLPVISDMTMFTSNRVIIIPFDRHFEPWEQDRTLKEEFARPTTQSAILNWLIAGYRILHDEGFIQPSAVTAAISAYQYESDKLAQFTEERLERMQLPRLKLHLYMKSIADGAVTMGATARTTETSYTNSVNSVVWKERDHSQAVTKPQS